MHNNSFQFESYISHIQYQTEYACWTFSNIRFVYFLNCLVSINFERCDWLNSLAYNKHQRLVQIRIYEHILWSIISIKQQRIQSLWCIILHMSWKQFSRIICFSFYPAFYIRIDFEYENNLYIRLFTIHHKHWWFSGRMLACHAGDPGPIPGQCTFFVAFLFLDLSLIEKRWYSSFVVSCMTMIMPHCELSNWQDMCYT
jgi:hypothetical protein